MRDKPEEMLRVPGLIRNRSGLREFDAGRGLADLAASDGELLVFFAGTEPVRPLRESWSARFALPQGMRSMSARTATANSMEPLYTSSL